MATVAVIDYGMGNLRSVSQAVMHVAIGSGVEVVVTNRPDRGVRPPTAWSCPGRAPCATACASCRTAGLQQAVAARRRQQAADGRVRGHADAARRTAKSRTRPAWGLIPGTVRALSPGRPACSPTAAASRCRKWAGTASRQTHARPHPPVGGRARQQLVLFRPQLPCRPRDAAHSAGLTDYGLSFTCALARDNIFATQFHPEKSADQGLALYRNFLHWKP